MLRITVVRLLAGIVYRYNLISKQKMFLPAAGAGFRHRASGFRLQEKERIERNSPDPFS
jgi:hypothetical protein